MMKVLNHEEYQELKERGFELSDSFHSYQEAKDHALYLKELNNDPSNMVSVGGYYWKPNEVRPYVVYKHTIL
jgi:hypothetical protein